MLSKSAADLPLLDGGSRSKSNKARQFPQDVVNQTKRASECNNVQILPGRGSGLREGRHDSVAEYRLAERWRAKRRAHVDLSRLGIRDVDPRQAQLGNWPTGDWHQRLAVRRTSGKDHCMSNFYHDQNDTQHNPFSKRQRAAPRGFATSDDGSRGPCSCK